jgi:prophage regulatory protein
MQTQNPITVVMLRLREVLRVTGLARSTVYKLIHDGKFPRPIKLGARAVAWRSDAVNGWIQDRTNASLNTSLKGTSC